MLSGTEEEMELLLLIATPNGEGERIVELFVGTSTMEMVVLLLVEAHVENGRLVHARISTSSHRGSMSGSSKCLNESEDRSNKER